ncbi:phosphotransferase family protein [Actinomadura viridis]|uniref:phosphotransferase family protein n=1 Tax=Actinomadura viridis TaxID=58110 RepID=UPI0036CA7388
MTRQPRPDILTDLRRHHATGEPGLPERLAQAGLRPVTGGRNNTVYAWDPGPGHPTEIIKLYRTDDRGRGGREWTALTHLHGAHPGDAPEPLWEDLDHVQPAMGMTYLPGTSLPETASDQHPTALKALAAVHGRIQALPIPAALADTPRVDHWAHCTRRLTDVWPVQLADAADDPATPTMHRLLRAWHDHDDQHGHRTYQDTPVLSRGDSNLLNWLWSPAETRIRCVDFEFIGHSTAAYDAAELTEHISARDIPDHLWEEILPDLGVTTSLRPAYESAQRTCALRWLAVLWKQRTRRTPEFEAQLVRAASLLDSPAMIG